MKHQQVVVDYFQMFKTSFSCIVLVFFVWIFVKLIQSIFLLPRYLERNHEVLVKTLEKHGITDEELKAYEEEEAKQKKEQENANTETPSEATEGTEGTEATAATEATEATEESKKTI